MLKRSAEISAASLLLSLGIAAHGNPTFTDPEIAGMANYIAIGGDRIAFLANERAMDTDLDGDGFLNDSVLVHRHTDDTQLVNTGIATWSFRIETDGRTIVFLQHEINLQVDLTGDGERRDVVLSYYDIASGQVTYTGIVPHYNTGSYGNLRSYSVDGNIIAFVVREFRLNEDLNGDGDINDYAIRYYDIETGLVHDTGLSSSFATVSDGRIASTVPESAMRSDLNGDGDTDDNVVVVYDTASTLVVPVFALPPHNLSSPGSFPAIDGDRVVFRVHESWWGYDVDHDGRLSTQNLMIGFDLQTRQAQYLGFTGSKQLWLDGDFVAYYTSEHDIGSDINADGDTTWDWLTAFRHLPSGQTHYVPEASEYGIGAGGMFARQSESRFGADANGDGDTSDALAYYVAAVFEQPVVCVEIDIVCRLTALDQLIFDLRLNADITTAFTGIVQQAIAAFDDDNQPIETRITNTFELLEQLAAAWSLHYGIDLPMAEGDQIFDAAKPIHTILEDAMLNGASVLVPDDDADDGDEDDDTGELAGEDIIAQLFAALELPGVSSYARDVIVAQLDALMTIGMNPELSDQQKAALAGPVVARLVADIDGLIASGEIAAGPGQQIHAALALLLTFLQQSGG